MCSQDLRNSLTLGRHAGPAVACRMGGGEEREEREGEEGERRRDSTLDHESNHPLTVRAKVH